ncbi:hypothetical protein SAMN04244575_06842 [Sinorhizobium meliloti]|nr:hypothetical protein SAMN04244575_06842 [Sinorhizobium meliloti]
MKSTAPTFMASTAMGTSSCPVTTIEGYIDLVIAEIAQKLYAGYVRHSQVRDENPVSEAARWLRLVILPNFFKSRELPICPTSNGG